MTSAAEIAAALRLPEPTAQQKAVIEAGLVPSLVLAGAGSGKTETMANRVVYLLANGQVAPNEILGLTFTRKAAGELAERVTRRVAGLDGTAFAPAESDPFDAPAIATYNSFASTLFREHALAIGREPDALVLGDASAWQLARRVVVGSDDERLVELGKSVDTVTEGVLTLSRALADNIADPADVRRMIEDFARLADLPYGNARVKQQYRTLREAIAVVGTLPPLLALAEEYQRQKIRRGLIEFSDQIALALEIVRRVPGVAAAYRARYRVVLLDEYQDTSVVQTRLLAELFRGTAVMAVGDPHQSIYGWRGASASNLARFGRDFSGPDGARTYALSTSWRNPGRVLDAANTLVAPLSLASPIPVERLERRPGSGDGELTVAFRETVLEEADAVACWFEERLGERPDEAPPTAALLCRSLKKVAVFTRALAEHGVPFRVLGVGGLLEDPAVVDLVSTLRVLHDPTAGPYLLRLLTGARWRIGVRDIKALRELASWLSGRDAGQQQLADGVRDLLRASTVADEGASIVDALDFVATAREGHGALRDFSEEGLRRMRTLARELAGLRSRVGLDLLDLVALVQQELLLDVEVAANESAPIGRAGLDGFTELVADFVAGDASAGLGSFLSWLELAEERENLSPRTEEAEPGTVQVLTIHGSKGLEWDLVAVPRLVEGELPAPPRSSKGWLAFGELPYEFRGDAADLPALAWRAAATGKDFDEAHGTYCSAVTAAFADEQRRLAYVAVTRARRALLLTGSFWWTQRKPRGPGLFLRELQSAGLISDDALPEGPQSEENPLDELVTHVPWPSDPLGARARRVLAAADAVRAADPAVETPWSERIDLLVAERERRRRDAELVELPVRISASAFKDYVSDPSAMAAALRRPMPQRPYRQTRLGTLFHSWVEQRYGLGGLDELVDALPGDRDLDLEDLAESADLEALQRTFERSPWADLRPEAVELEIHLPFADRIVVCKMDAVFERNGRWEIVDWKTGRAPKDAADLEQKQFQLALYRLAFAEWRGVDPDLIDAAFYFVAEDRIIRPERLYSEAELRDRWVAAV
ncbi:ATP-dependent DNA helicase [Naasia sp. SYSU D00948]|uniref:ATP-dependent DNA helicase n=1 Tax=Naasia sp. SYSU D00948 TaxID=2817379 RepID=UPI001B310C0C|nr:ATP-dependent DNA helicase [Naasia sp. SYSU D00948]